MTIEIIILAAGHGTRMHSSIPKVLHKIGGKPLLQHLLETVLKIQPQRIHVVLGYKKAQVIERINALMAEKAAFINWVHQTEPLGTGHAVAQAIPHINPNSTVLIMNGDTPLIQFKTLEQLTHCEDELKLLTMTLDDPTGMGRVVRNKAQEITGVIEHKDADYQQLKIKEINTNCMAGCPENISNWLDRIQNKNTQKEYYLPDIIACAVADRVKITSLEPCLPEEVLGVNSKLDLARLERIYQSQQAMQLILDGVTIIDAERLDIRGECHLGMDCIIDINVILEGKVQIGDHCYIGPSTLIKNSIIGNHCVIEPNSIIEGAVVRDHCSIGPFARIRPGTHLADAVRIGNFVETKQSQINEQSKVSHLSYVGDSIVGTNVNIGAGVITCNYDGVNKHQTVIGDNVFIGSDSQLVAPVRIGDGATVGAGSTITANVEKKTLAISRSKQKAIHGWKRSQKK